MGKAAIVRITNGQYSARGASSPIIPAREMMHSDDPAVECRNRPNLNASTRKQSSHAAENCRSARDVGLSGSSKKNFMTLIRFKCGEIFLALNGCDLFGAVFFAQKKILQDERIHIRREETAQSFGRLADNRFAAHIEARIDQQGALGFFLKRFQQTIEPSMS